MFDKIKGFEKKQKIWQRRLESNDMIYFPILRKENSPQTKKYVKE